MVILVSFQQRQDFLVAKFLPRVDETFSAALEELLVDALIPIIQNDFSRLLLVSMSSPTRDQ